MEIRQKEEARDIDTRDVSLRAAGENAARVQRGVSAMKRIGDSGAKTAGKTAGYIRNSARNMSLSQESRAALSYLSREQRKQWNSYSSREQAQILNAVEKKVERRMRYQTNGTTARPISQEHMDMSSAYRMSEAEYGRLGNPEGNQQRKLTYNSRMD
ncbi:MAG: hypothetical protein LUH07_10990, partial [Lachnospiraceae bacterium]|nr:hypothetical protein [Lachnospiraceae bacterium]